MTKSQKIIPLRRVVNKDIGMPTRLLEPEVRSSLSGSLCQLNVTTPTPQPHVKVYDELDNTRSTNMHQFDAQENEKKFEKLQKDFEVVHNQNNAL